MACLMHLPIVLPLSHDSIAVGEDGPTHQPVEQLAMMRSMVNIQAVSYTHLVVGKPLYYIS